MRYRALSSAIRMVLRDYRNAVAPVDADPLIETLCAALLPEQYSEGEDGSREKPERFVNENPKPKW